MTNPPPLQVNRFYVYTGDLDAPDAYEARIIWGDQLRGELEASKRGVDPRKQQMLLATFWCWAEAVRTGRTSAKFDDWRATVLDLADADALDKQAAKEQTNDAAGAAKEQTNDTTAAAKEQTIDGDELHPLDPTSARPSDSLSG